jgi:hypothetical protein
MILPLVFETYFFLKNLVDNTVFLSLFIDNGGISRLIKMGHSPDLSVEVCL